MYIAHVKQHIKVYLTAFYPLHGDGEFIPCEVCWKKAVDIHHIDARGMGGTKREDRPEDLMALCRYDHIKYGDKVQHVDFLRKKHEEFMQYKER